jgi:hypothetical protein
MKHTTAIFRQINKEKMAAHHDALEFPDGQVVLLTFLSEGQQATVLQLPAEPKTAVETEAQRRTAYVGWLFPKISTVATSGPAWPLCHARLQGQCRDSINMENVVSNHKFKIGQSVNYTSGRFGFAASAKGIYKITQLLPSEGDDFQHEIKSAAEPHERMVKESQLTPA